MSVPHPRHAMARPWHPCRYIATHCGLSSWKPHGVDCRVKPCNDGMDCVRALSRCRSPNHVIPWLDHGIHADTSPHTAASPRGNLTEWIAGSSPAMRNGLRTNGLCQSAFPMPLPEPRHAMARPWHPCRYITTHCSLSSWKSHGVDCRVKPCNDGERGGIT